MIDPNNPYNPFGNANQQSNGNFDFGQGGDPFNNPNAGFSQFEDRQQVQPYADPSAAYEAAFPRPEVDARTSKAAAVARIAFNGAGIVADIWPTVIDPSSLLDAATFAGRAAGMMRSKFPNSPLDGLLSHIENFDPTPDLSTKVAVGSVAVEAVTQIVPSSVTRVYQIFKDLKRLFARRSKNTDGQSYPQPPAPNHDPYNLL